MQDYSILWPIVRVNIYAQGAVTILILLLFSKQKLTKPKAKLSKKTIKNIEIVTRLLLASLAIFMFCDVSLPVVKDTLWIINSGLSWDKIPTKTGRISWKNNSFRYLHSSINQAVYFEDQKSVGYYMYLRSPSSVSQGYVYKVYYLPNSRAILKIHRENSS